MDAPVVILSKDNFSVALDFSSQAYIELWLSDFPSLLLGIEHILPDKKIVPRSGLNAAAMIDSSLNGEIENVSFFKTAGLLYIPFSNTFILVPRWEARGLLKGKLSSLQMPVLG